MESVMNTERPRRNQRQAHQQQERHIASTVQQHLQAARQTMNQTMNPVYMTYPKEHFPVFYTNAVYPVEEMNTMEDLEEVLSIHSASAEPLPTNMEINGTNGVPVGNASPVYTSNSAESSSNGSQTSSLHEAGPSGLNPAAQAGAQINIQSSTQATVQMNTQQNLPPQQGQIIRNYSTTVPPPGMKILKKNTPEKDARTKQKERNEAWKLRKQASVNIETASPGPRPVKLTPPLNESESEKPRAPHRVSRILRVCACHRSSRKHATYTTREKSRVP